MIKLTDIESFIKSSVNALKKEIDSNKNKKITVYDIKLNDKIDCYLYTFRIKKKSCLAINTQYTLLINEKKMSITVTDIDNDIITMESGEYIGDSIESAELESNEIFLIEKLIERIEAMGNKDLSEIVQMLLFNDHQKRINDKPIKIFPYDEKIESILSIPIRILFGPPGTGKTKSIIRLINECNKNGLRVLLLAHSNQAVDEVTERLCEQDYVRGETVRVGNTQSEKIKNYGDVLTNQLSKFFYEDLRKKENFLIEKIHNKEIPNDRIEYYKKLLYELRKKFKEYEGRIISSAKFVATTFCTAYINPSIYKQSFDVVIIDEAGMASLPQIIFASTLASKNFICVGDYYQLPSVTKSKDEILTKDIFEYCEISEAVRNHKDHDFLYMLDTQHRMHSGIASFLSENVYCGLLKTAEGIDEKHKTITEAEPLIGKPVVIADTGVFSPQKLIVKNGYCINLLNACVSVAIALKNVSKHRVSIITPYSNQAELINHLLKAASPENKNRINVSCDTVHKFQGSEEDIIIFDSVDSCSFEKPGYMLRSNENNISLRLFNVSMSRAKGKFVFVGDVTFLKNNLPEDNLIRKFLYEFSQPDIQMSKSEIIDSLIESTQYNLNVYNTKSFSFTANDQIKKAKSEINLFVSNYDKIFNDIIDEKILDGVTVRIISSEPNNLPIHTSYETDPLMKEDIIIIDSETILYNAVPEENITVAINNKLLAIMLRNHFGMKISKK